MKRNNLNQREKWTPVFLVKWHLEQHQKRKKYTNSNAIHEQLQWIQSSVFRCKKIGKNNNGIIIYLHKQTWWFMQQIFCLHYWCKKSWCYLTHQQIPLKRKKQKPTNTAAVSSHRSNTAQPMVKKGNRFTSHLPERESILINSLSVSTCQKSLWLCLFDGME